MSSEEVTLRLVTPADVREVVEVAARGADPADVMPPDGLPDPAIWTAARRRRYAEFLRSRLRPLPDGRQETSLLVLVDGRVAGVARLMPTEDRSSPVDHEVGVWLARAARGRGVGRATLERLADHARELGIVALVAETTADNGAALTVLGRLGATPAASASGVVVGRIELR